MPCLKQGDIYIYAVFMCHLSVEKALKGLYSYVLKDVPPKTHNLIYLLTKIGIFPEPDIAKFITKLNMTSIVTRYPDDLEKIQTAYSKNIVKDIVENTKDVLKWVRAKL